MGKSLAEDPRGNFGNLAAFPSALPLPADGETPEPLVKGNGQDTPMAFTTTKAFLNGVEVETVTGSREKVATLGAGYFSTVTNNQAKILLPLGTPAGKLVRITAEANRKERYLGDVSGDAVCAVTIDGDVHFLAGASAGKPTYLSPSSGHGASYAGGRWVQSAGVAALGNEDYPWLADWSGMPSGPPGEVGSVVEKNPVAADENWEVVGDSTYELFVFHNRGGGGALTVNGIVLPQFVNTNVGWVKAGSAVPKISASGYAENYMSVVFINNSPADGSLGSNFSDYGITLPVVGKRVTRVDISITSGEAG